MESRIVKFDMTPPQPYPFDPVPAVIACEGRLVVTQGVQGESITPVVAMDQCQYAVINRSSCIAMLDRVEYAGIPADAPLSFKILFPEDNNGVPAVRFAATSFRDVSFNPTIAYAGVSFLCSIPSYTFSVGRCTTDAVLLDLLGVFASSTETTTTASSTTGAETTTPSGATLPPLPCPELAGATLSSHFFAVESDENDTLVWAYAHNWPQPVSIANCAVPLAPGGQSAIPAQCLPGAAVYASVMSLVSPSLLSARQVIYPFFSRQSLHVAESGYSNGGLIAVPPSSSTTAVSMQAIQFAFLFAETSAGLSALGYPDLPALNAVGPPKIALRHRRGQEVWSSCCRGCTFHSLSVSSQEVWFPLASVPDFSTPVILDESLTDLEIRCNVFCCFFAARPCWCSL